MSPVLYPVSCCCRLRPISSFWSPSFFCTGHSRGSGCWRSAVILFANYFFYAKWDLLYLALIPAVSSCDYVFGLGLQYSERPLVRRILVTASIVMNVGLLVSFKYMPFFFENWAAVTGRPAPEWHWMLPISLSFYVFQALTYTIDLYRRDAKGTRSYLAHLAAVSFFPTTLAGPITRVSSLIDQLEKREAAGSIRRRTRAVSHRHGADEEAADRGFSCRRIWSIACSIFRTSTAAPRRWSRFTRTRFRFTTIFRDIPISPSGSALLLGIQLPRNFNVPYAAENVADFWRRWHITLSNWLRDYLYFSLPGKRSKWHGRT